MLQLGTLPLWRSTAGARAPTVVVGKSHLPPRHAHKVVRACTFCSQRRTALKALYGMCALVQVRMPVLLSFACPLFSNVRAVSRCLLPCTDGSQLIVAVGVRVLVYDAGDGDLMHSLKGVWRPNRDLLS